MEDFKNIKTRMPAFILPVIIIAMAVLTLISAVSLDSEML